jgi:hypothetical protein
MSDNTDGDKKPKPIFNPDDVVEPKVDFGSAAPAPADPTPADVAVEEPAAIEKPKPARKPKADKTAAATEAAAASTDGSAATGQVAPATESSDFAGREVVYVQAPIPPRLKGNRGVGSALAVLGALVFAAVYAGLGYVLIAVGLAAPGATFAEFILSPEFLIPVPIFLVAFLLLVLLVNRGGWAAHVFGSLLVGLAVYFGTAGVAALLFMVSGSDVPSFGNLLSQPFIIIAALVAREVSIWIGLAIAARGRRVKARNLELVDEWEREHADTKAQYERAGTAA